jgi:cyanophycin synthetase
VVENGVIVLFDGGNRFEVTPVDEVPATFRERRRTWSPTCWRRCWRPTRPHRLAGHSQGLFSFVPSARMTPGRMNLFELDGKRLWWTYAHNPAALMALGTYLEKLEAYPKIGIVTGVGDRRDEDIVEIGVLSARFFDEVVIRFDQDLRGREADNIRQLIEQGIRIQSPNKPVQVCPTEEEALHTVLRNAPAGAFIVDCTEKVDKTLEIVDRLCREGAGSAVNMPEDTDTSQAVASGDEITGLMGASAG